MGKLVLVAEDEATSQRMIAAVLKQCGYEAKLSGNGRECLAAIEQGMIPDLLLLDLEMPVLNGFAVLKRLEELGHLESFPTIVFTAQNDVKSVLKAVELGAYDYIVKPFSPLGLGKRIQDLVFDIDELALRNILLKLRVADTSLYQSRGLQGWAQRGLSPYPATHHSQSICLLLPLGAKPSDIAKGSTEDLLALVRIFRQGEHGWRKVWPTRSSLRS